MQRQIFMILISFIFAIIVCGASAAAADGTSNETQNSSVCAGDPIINGTITINEFGHVRPLANATIMVNSTNKTLATTKTDENGYYSVNFYSTNTQFNVTAAYMGCNAITNTLNVTLGGDGNYYGTSNFQLTPIVAQYTSTSGNNGTTVWIQGDNMYGFAGALNVVAPASGGGNYYAFCIDIYTMIYNNDYLLVSGPLPGTTGNFSSFLLNSIDWGKVNYIINNYRPFNATEGAAMQCAIWYFTSAPYGKYNATIGGGGLDPNHPNYYQFLTYNSTFNATRYDGYSTTYGAYVVQRAFQMINNATSMLYPSTVTVVPDITTALNGQNVNVTATVKDQYGNPLQNVTVNFSSTSGTLSVTSGLTNSAGQISTILSGVADNGTANVIASVLGNYGNLLYDDQYNSTNKTQNLVAINLLPDVVSATSIINFNIQSNVTITQTVNGGSTATVNVGDPLTFVITARCTGPNNATGLMITDLFPPGFVPTSVTPSIGSYTNGVWTIPLLTVGSNATLTIIGNATSNMAGITTNNSAVRTFQNEYDPQSKIATVSIYTKKANVAVTQTVNGGSSANVNVGDVINYIITATNLGPDMATGLRITDLLPAGLSNVSYAASTGVGSYNVATGLWIIGNLNNGANATLNITGTVTSAWAGLNVTNYANRTAQTEYNTLSNTTSTRTYTKKADLSITQTVNSPVNVNDAVTYRVTVTNNGPDTATNINIRDIMPAGFTAGTPSVGTFNSATGIWTIPSLANGINATLNITGTATAAMAGNTTNNTVTWINQTEYDSTPANSTFGFYTKKADVVLTITTNYVDVHTSTAGVRFTYTATNNGPDTATNIVIRVTEPALTGTITRTPSTGSTYTGSGTTRTWTIATLASGSSITLNITGTSPGTAQWLTGNDTKISQTEYDQNTPDTALKSIYVYTSKANVTVSQTVNGGSSATVNVGDKVSFVITATNGGPNGATGLQITDLLPAGLSNISYYASSGTYNTTTGLWIIGNLNNGATVTLTLNGTVTSAWAGLNITNYANRTAQSQYNALSNTSNTTVYTKLANVAINQTVNNGSSATANVGDIITYIITATNNGPNDATGLQIKDLLPAGFIFQSANTYGSGTFNQTSGIWNIGTLLNGTTATLNITGLAGSGMAGLNLTNYANRTAQTEYNSLSNTTNTTVYTKKADLTLTQTANGLNTGTTTVNVNDRVSYIVTVKNNGPDTATNINITDIIPSGLTGVTITPSVGSYNSTTGIWFINSLTNGANATLNITGLAGANMAGLNTTNTANVTNLTEYDPTIPGTTSIPVYTKKADISITQTVNSPVNVNDAVTYRVTVTNNGPDTATNINIRDIVPAGFTAGTPSVGTFNSTTGIWTISSLASLANATLNITGTATAAMAGNTTNNTVTWINQTEYDSTPANSTIGFYTKKANVSVIQAVNGVISTTVNVNGIINYIITATNNGPDNATGLQITDLLPVGFIFQSANTYGSGTFNQTSGIWNIGTLLNGTTATLNITGLAGSSMAGLNLTNYANRTAQTEYNGLSNTTSTTVYTKLSNVTITNTANQSSLNVGQTATFTVTVTNNGPDSANIQITDLLSQFPAGFTAGTPTFGTYNSTTGIWTITNLTTGTPVTLTFSGVLQNSTAGTNITNHAIETQTEYPFTVAITDAVIHVNKADVALTQTVNGLNSTKVNVGDVVSYIIRATNNGPDNATGLQITDLLPAGLTNLVYSASTGTYNSITGLWNIGNLTNGAFATLNITGTVTSTWAGLNITNYANRTAQTEYNSLSDKTSTVVYTKLSDPRISQTVNGQNSGISTVNVGDIITIVVTAECSGPDNATNINITDTLPAGLNIISIMPGSVSETFDINTGRWYIPFLEVGKNTTLTIVGNVTAAMAGLSVNNTAFEVNQTEYNPTPGNSTSIPIYTKLASVAISQTVNGASSAAVNVGDTVSYIINVTNNGPDTATGLKVTDLLPAGLTNIVYTASNGNSNYNLTTGVWDIGSLISSGIATLNLTGTVTSAWAGLNTTNYANITAQNEYNNLTSVSATNVYTKLSNITITNTANSNSLNVGQTGTFTITVTNNGPDAATNIKINDILPAGFTADTHGIGNYNGTVWTIDSLPNGTSATLTFTCNLTSGMAGTNITNSANAAWNEYPNTENITDAIIHVKLAQLNIIQTVNSLVNVNNTVTYQVSVTNNGPDTATNINIRDIVPAGFTAGTPSVGTFNSSTGIWFIPSLLNLASATLNITGNTTAAMAGIITNNTATELNQTEYTPVLASNTTGFYTKLANVTLSQVGSYSGNKITFIVTATNKGPDTATCINIRDIIPAGLTGVTVTPSIGTYNSTTGIWYIDSLLNGTIATLNITGNATPQATINNTVTWLNQTEYNSNTSNSIIGVYAPAVDISITHTPWYYDTKTGTYVYSYTYSNTPEYTVVVNNNGPDDATGVIVDYLIGSGLKYEGASSDNGTITYSDGKITFNIGTIPAKGRAVLKVMVRILALGNQTPEVTNIATLAHVNQFDTNSSNDNASCALIVTMSTADVGLNQTQEVYTENGTKYIRYTITAFNNGPDNSTNVKITDILPAQVQWVSDNSGGTYNHNKTGTGAGVWTIGDFNANDTPKTLVITCKIIQNATIKNTATKSSQTTGQFDWNSLNNAQTCIYIPGGVNYNSTVDIKITHTPAFFDTKTGDYQYSFTYSNTPEYSIIVANNGPDDATGVVIEYLIGSGLEYAGASSDGGTISYSNGKITFNIGNIPAKGRAVLKVMVRILALGNQTPEVTNIAGLAHVDQNDTNSSNNNASCALIVTMSTADIGLNQTQEVYTENGTQYIRYTITAFNNGPDNSTNVKITDILPAQVQWVSDNSGGTYNHNKTGTGAGVWNIGNFNATDAPKTLVIVCKVVQTGTIKNTATKSSQTTGQFDWNSLNNAETTTVTVLS